VNKEAYIRKSHSFTKESLEDLGILSRYMGDIGESAVLRYLIINEIRKVPVFKPNRELQLSADFTIEKLEEFEKKELDGVAVPRRIVPELLGEKTRAFLEGLKDEKKGNV